MDFAKKTRDPLFVFVILASEEMDIHALVCFKFLVRIVFFDQGFTLLKYLLKLPFSTLLPFEGRGWITP